MKKAGILLVEDEQVIALSISKSLERLGYSVVDVVNAGDAAVCSALDLSPDLILMDIMLEGPMDGIETVRMLRARSDIPVIYLTAYSDTATVARARETMPYGFLNKPINERDLFTNIESALYKHTMERKLAESEAMLRSIVRAAPIGIGMVAGPDNALVWCNRALCSMTGYSGDELTGRAPSMIYPDDEAYARVIRESRAEIAAFGIATVETRWKRKNGDFIDVQVSTTLLDPERTESGVIFTAADITARRRAEEELKKSESKYRLLMENISDNIWSMDLATMRFNYSNPSGTSTLGYNARETLDLKIEDIVMPDSIAVALRLLAEELSRDGQPGADPDRSRTIELEQIHKNGSIVWTEVTIKFIRDDSGKPTGLLGVSRNITRRKQAEAANIIIRDLARSLGTAAGVDEALALSLEAAIRASKMDAGGIYLINNESGSIDLVCHWGLADDFVRNNSHFVKDTPTARLILRGIPLYDLYPDMRVRFDKDIAGEGLKSLAVIPIKHKDTVIACMNVASHTGTEVSLAARSALESIAAHIGDVIVRLNMQESLRRSEERFRLMVEYSPFPIAIVDAGDAVSYLNRTFTRITGYAAGDIPEMDSWWNTAYPDPSYREKVRTSWEKAVLNSLASGTPVEPRESEIRCRDGSMRWIEFRMVPVADVSLIIMNDLTEKRITQEMIIQNEKMSSLGGLAAGMAHEINNPLGIMLQGIQGSLNRLDPKIRKNRETAKELGTDLETIRTYLDRREVLDYLRGMQDAGQRAAKIVSNMLQFSRKSGTGIVPAALNRVIDQAVEIASNDYDLKKKYDFKKIEIVRKYDPKLPDVPCSETGIEQVILNLLKNASQAMSEKKEKKFRPSITIRTGRDGKYAFIEISDNGPGIEGAAQRRIFEPFYTTKSSGIGTGLGLSVCYYIITKNHNGSITVESEPGSGALFRIKIPLERPS